MIAIICLSALTPQDQIKPLDRLRELIKKLGNDDPQVREKSQNNIMKLVEEESRSGEDLKGLVNEIRKEIKDGKDAEVVGRLQTVIERLTEAKWRLVSKSPLEERSYHTSILVGNKVLIWGGYAGGNKYYNDGALYDVENDKWVKIKDSPLEMRNYYTLTLIENKLLIWGGFYKGKYYNDGAIYELPVIWE